MSVMRVTGNHLFISFLGEGHSLTWCVCMCVNKKGNDLRKAKRKLAGSWRFEADLELASAASSVQASRAASPNDVRQRHSCSSLVLVCFGPNIKQIWRYSAEQLIDKWVNRCGLSLPKVNSPMLS